MRWDEAVPLRTPCFCLPSCTTAHQQSWLVHSDSESFTFLSALLFLYLFLVFWVFFLPSLCILSYSTTVGETKTKTQMSGQWHKQKAYFLPDVFVSSRCVWCVFSARMAQFSWRCVVHTCHFMTVKWLFFSWMHTGPFLPLSTPVLCESVWTWLRWRRRGDTVGAVSHWSRGTVQFLRQGFLHSPLSFLRSKRLPAWTGSKALFSLRLNSRCSLRNTELL